MNTNTNSAQERTASIDLDKLEKLEALAHELRFTRVLHQDHFEKFRQLTEGTLTVIALARRSLTSGAPAEPVSSAEQAPELPYIEGFTLPRDLATAHAVIEKLRAAYAEQVISREAAEAHFLAAQDQYQHYRKMYNELRGQLSSGATAKTEQAGDVELIRVPAHEADSYCRILTILGMEEEGDPVAEVQRLSDAAAGAGSAEADTKGAALDDRALFESEWRKAYAMPEDAKFSPFVAGRYLATAVDDAFQGWRMARRASSPSRDAGQEEASTQTVRGIDTPEFRRLFFAARNAAWNFDGSTQELTALIAYIDGRTAGTEDNAVTVETVIEFGASLLGYASEADAFDKEEAIEWVRNRWEDAVKEAP